MADLDEFAAIHRQIHQQNFAHLFKDQHFLFEERKESEGQPCINVRNEYFSTFFSTISGKNTHTPSNQNDAEGIGKIDPKAI